MSKTKTPSTPKVDNEKREFLETVTTTFGVAGAACVAYPFVKSMAPSAAVKAEATLEVDVSDIPAGQSKTVLWRGKPVQIWHRTEQQIAKATSEDTSPELLDPAKDAERVKNPKYLVVLAVCTHLGCVPMHGGEFSGWRCPCHGSQFDGSGRLRRGPAATNLEVPPYEFIDETTIRLG